MRCSAIPLVLLFPFVLGACHGRLKLPEDIPPVDHVAAARSAEIRSYPWPDYVTGEDRSRIEDALRVIWDIGGRDGRDAEALLVGMDEGAEAADLRVAGRLVSEMKTAIDTYGAEAWEGKSRIMVLDRMLRKLDGMQERLLGEEQTLDLDDSAARALRLVRAWNWWYQEGRFLRRYKVWDPRVDLVDTHEPEADDGNLAD